MPHGKLGFAEADLRRRRPQPTERGAQDLAGHTTTSTEQRPSQDLLDRLLRSQDYSVDQQYEQTITHGHD